MRPGTLTEEQERTLDFEGNALREMMKSDGWKVMAKIFHSTLQRYDSTHGIETLKALMARKDAISMLNDWMEAVVQKVSKLEHKETIRRAVREKLSRSGLVTIGEEDEER